MRPVGTSRRFVLLLILTAGLLSVLFVASFRAQPQGVRHPLNDIAGPDTVPAHHFSLDASTLTGHAIAPKLGNATAKAELGRAAWKVLHTTFARFPDKPTRDESLALQSYIHLFQRLYPCGECSEHFSKILEKFPPQVSSRSAAAAWGCHVHNEVNKRLEKEIFDCSQIGDFYDCGCADDEGIDGGEKHAKSTASYSEKVETPKESEGKLSGQDGGEHDLSRIHGGNEPLELEKEG
ncbi:sulfhydryl oxidase [Saccharata proteae CBS 121410]|uniref:Sulfhydryl oxidase n=1 Tax=Saccharata proteae CBS 121410 TaxID=1314787 RepID=A0A9P4I0D7_9PEZI|nr:sulfhydryl oxidase [Saccharata proteae CBS 121410]